MNESGMLIENTDYREEVLDIGSSLDVKLVRDFLAQFDLNYNPDAVEYTMVLYNLNDELIGTGSMNKNVLKYIAVAPKYRETAAFSMIITELTQLAIADYKTIFVFTKPSNVQLFKGLGFRHVETAEPYYSLLEYGISSVSKYQETIEQYKKETKTDSVASIVMNCNPFTNGHKYLIEKASSENELVYLFLVQEDLSVFPFDVRWKLVEEGTAHLDNVVMIPGGDYVVSGKTFPQYFLKGVSENEITKCQGRLDIKIFCRYIAPVMGIKKRYVGTERRCKTTSAYNDAMREILPKNGLEYIEVDRKKEIIYREKESISASKIRNAIKNDKLDLCWHLLPKSTQDFFKSEASEVIKTLIKKSSSRH